MTTAANTLDVTTATFEKEVIERSRKAPVLVDFWATWCGPCRALSPVLEKLAAEMQGRFTLAKIDIDQSPDLADAFGVQSVPTVALVKDAQIVDGFVGAQPEAKIREVLGRHLGASDPLAQALEKEHAGDVPGALAVLRSALEKKPDHGPARAHLARLLVLSGRIDEGRQHFERLSSEDRETDAGRSVASLLALQSQKGDLAELEAAVAARPDDVAARLELGRALLAARRTEAGLEELYRAAQRDLAFNGGEPRKALLEAFEALGEADPLVREYRRRLSLLLCA